MRRKLHTVLLCLYTASLRAWADTPMDAMGMVQTSLAEALSDKPRLQEARTPEQHQSKAQSNSRQEEDITERKNRLAREKAVERKEEAARQASIKAKMDEEFRASRERAEKRIAESKAKTKAAIEAASLAEKQMLETKRREDKRAALRRRWRLKQVKSGNITKLSEYERNMMQRTAKQASELILHRNHSTREAAKADRLRKYQHRQEFKAREAKRDAEARAERGRKFKAAQLERAAERAAAPPRPPPAVQQDASSRNKRIHLKFVNNLGQGMELVVPTNARMIVPMTVASQRMGVDLARIRFSYNGKQIKPSDSMEDHGLEDQDTINVDGVPEE